MKKLKCSGVGLWSDLFLGDIDVIDGWDEIEEQSKVSLWGYNLV